MLKSMAREKAETFALDMIELYKVLQDNLEYVLSTQLLLSGTSNGANTCEALAAYSKKDFHYKMTTASKECRETHYRLTLLMKSGLVDYNLHSELSDCNELNRILTSTVKTASETLKKGSNQNQQVK
jgi:four helix bundle protein